MRKRYLWIMALSLILTSAGVVGKAINVSAAGSKTETITVKKNKGKSYLIYKKIRRRFKGS